MSINVPPPPPLNSNQMDESLKRAQNQWFQIINQSSGLMDIHELLGRFDQEPLIGIEFLVEEQSLNNAESTFRCLLCQRDFSLIGIISDLLGAEHRIKYLVSYFNMFLYSVPKFHYRYHPIFCENILYIGSSLQ